MQIYDRLCKPAKFYFIISVVSYIFILLQNLGTQGRFTLGGYSCRHASPALLLLVQALYIVFWTWLLDIICKINKGISWVIVLFPYLLLFVALGIVLMQGIKKDKIEGYGDGALSQYTI